jgi:hypothetical protein
MPCGEIQILLVSEEIDPSAREMGIFHCRDVQRLETIMYSFYNMGRSLNQFSFHVAYANKRSRV